ncbi:MAG: hypothetical protein GEU73_10630 [Chloroflexi bacterium]|nr:hypothetical protein [Chloroflexota bacterium]
MYFDSNFDLFSVRKLAPDGQDVDQFLVHGPASGWGVHPPDWAGALRTYVAERHAAGERLGLRTIEVSRDVGHPRADLPLLGEHLDRGAQHPLPRRGGLLPALGPGPLDIAHPEAHIISIVH